ncbi:hypothetical protein [Streptomyces sp. NPDC057287]
MTTYPLAETPAPPVTGGSHPLAGARRAPEELLARRTTGKAVPAP